MGNLSGNLNNINLDDTNYEEYDPDTIVHIKNLKNVKHLKKS